MIGLWVVYFIDTRPFFCPGDNEYLVRITGTLTSMLSVLGERVRGLVITGERPEGITTERLGVEILTVMKRFPLVEFHVKIQSSRMPCLSSFEILRSRFLVTEDDYILFGKVYADLISVPRELSGSMIFPRIRNHWEPTLLARIDNGDLLTDRIQVARSRSPMDAYLLNLGFIVRTRHLRLLNSIQDLQSQARFTECPADYVIFVHKKSIYETHAKVETWMKEFYGDQE